MSEQTKKLTLEDLINKKAEREFKKTIDVEVESLGGTITLKQVPLSSILRIIDDSVGTHGQGFVGIAEAIKLLIYHSCPLLQSEKLHEAYDCAEPFDIVEKLFTNDLMAINDIGEQLLKLYNLDLEKIHNMLKN